MRESSEDLLKQFVMSRSQEAFAALVSRHSGMVYATALRRVNGATGMAEDVTQQVFHRLAKKSKALAGKGCPAGWLYRQSCYLAANEMRVESRRKKREEIAMEMMEPNDEGLPKEVVRELDEALLALPEKTRNVLVLRFFEGLNYREIGAKFGLSEDGSRKQVDRALERLRERLERSGGDNVVFVSGAWFAGFGDEGDLGIDESAVGVFGDGAVGGRCFDGSASGGICSGGALGVSGSGRGSVGEGRDDLFFGVGIFRGKVKNHAGSLAAIRGCIQAQN